MSECKTGWTVFSTVLIFIGIIAISLAMGIWQGDAAGWGLFGFLLSFKALVILLIINAPPGGYGS